jgi:hypothetical protein
MASAIKSIKFDKETGKVTEVVLADKIAAAGVLLRSIIGPDVRLLALVKEQIVSLSDDDLAALERRIGALGGTRADLPALANSDLEPR